MPAEGRAQEKAAQGERNWAGGAGGGAVGWWGWGAGGARCSRRRHGASLDRALVPQPRKGAQRPASVWGSAPGCRCLQPPVAPRWWVLGSPQSSAGLGGVGGEPPTGPAAASSCTCGAEEGDAHLPGAPVSGPYEIWLFSWPGYCSNRLLASSLSASPMWQLCTQIRCPSYLQLHFMALLVKSLSATSKLGLMTTCRM